jgi:23S rRNA pseudouridine955/2504/2580 synthase
MKERAFPMQCITIGKNDAGLRLDKFLMKTYPNLPVSLMYKAIRKKDIKQNGKRCEISTHLAEGDVLTLYLKDEFFEKPGTSYDFLKAPIKLNILFEDQNIVLLDKKPGLLVHPDESYHFDSLIARLQHYLYEKGEYDPSEENSFAPALANRIDRNTGGIVIAAKNAEALRILNQKIKDRELEKTYLCVVHGRMPKQNDTLEAFLQKNEAQNRVYISSKPNRETRTIRTRYQVLEERGPFSLLKIDLLTGRTHQIRAHLAYIGHPLAGDGKYGTNKQNKNSGYPYQALYSYRLSFRFTSEAGILSYLNGKTFQVEDVWFLDIFHKTPVSQ